jgi:hypothetical protein
MTANQDWDAYLVTHLLAVAAHTINPRQRAKAISNAIGFASR